jgi:MFS family permease
VALTSEFVTEVERRLFWRVALRIIPLLFLCYIVAMLDRLNVGFAKLQFLSDLHMSEAVFGTAAGLLYLGYVLFEVPSNLMLQKYGVRLTLLRIMSLWGIFTILLAFANNDYEFYGLRFLVGAAEAGFFPGVVLYMSYWFPERIAARVTGLFILAVPVAGIIGSPLAAWTMAEFDGTYGLRGWQHLFILEGIPPIVLGILAYVLLANKPGNARWLSVREREIITSRIEGEDRKQPGYSGTNTFIDALKSPSLYLVMGCYFAFYSAENAILLWIPSLLRAGGVGSLAVIGWISSGISLGAAAGLVAVSYLSDRFSDSRLKHLLVCGAVTAASLVALPLGNGNAYVTAALLLVSSAALFSFLSLFWTAMRRYFQGPARAGGIALVNSSGAMGGLVSPMFIGWMKDRTGSFYLPIGILAVVFLFSLILLFLAFRRRAAVTEGNECSERLASPTK